MVFSPYNFSGDNAASKVQMEAHRLAVWHTSGKVLQVILEDTLAFGILRILVIFGATYHAVQTFSMMKFNKSKHRPSMNDDHFSTALCIATSGIRPDFNVFQVQNRA